MACKTGCGLRLRQDPRTGAAMVSALPSGWRQPVRMGDLLCRVDGLSTIGMEFEDVMGLLRLAGAPGTPPATLGFVSHPFTEWGGQASTITAMTEADRLCLAAALLRAVGGCGWQDSVDHEWAARAMGVVCREFLLLGDGAWGLMGLALRP